MPLEVMLNELRRYNNTTVTIADLEGQYPCTCDAATRILDGDFAYDFEPRARLHRSKCPKLQLIPVLKALYRREVNHVGPSGTDRSPTL